MKKVQIELELFLWIYDYIADQTTKNDTEAMMIRQAMNEKLDKILKHEEYSKRIKMTRGGKE